MNEEINKKVSIILNAIYERVFLVRKKDIEQRFEDLKNRVKNKKGVNI